jgi:hypothetical protein
MDSLCLPASLTVLSASALHGIKGLTSLAFEPRSNFREIKERAVSCCSSLNSICLPASVEVLGERCFESSDQLLSLTFESGSKLRDMKNAVFLHCPLLKSIFLPALLSLADGSPVIGSSIEDIQVDQSNPYFYVCGAFLISFEMKLISYFGLGGDLLISPVYVAICG